MDHSAVPKSSQFDQHGPQWLIDVPERWHHGGMRDAWLQDVGQNPRPNGERSVLVVDDDPSIVSLMRDYLEAEGYRVDGALTASEAQRTLQQVPVDCVLLDVMLPGESGFELIRWIRSVRPTGRRTRDVPVLFLSARDEDADKIRGLGLGGDDYIVKSATPTEVVARVKAVLRRSGRGDSAAEAVLDFGHLVLDVRAREVRVGDSRVSFTPREFDLLWLLAERPRQVFTYEQLLDRLWDGIGDRHTVTVHIRRLREKIEPDPEKPRYIATVWGIGYRFEGTAR
jgi:DNA-binding response OmpR family regulator